MKWIKRLLLIVVLLLGGAILFSAAGYFLFRGTPDWYASRTITPEEREAAARRAEDKFVETRNWAAQTQARYAAGQRDTQQDSETSEAEPITLTVSDAELNALFEKWAELHQWDRHYGRHLSDPAIILRDGRIILAARVQELRSVVSLHFAPRLDDDGRLHLHLARVMGGRLPLPRTMVSEYQENLIGWTESRLPAWQRAARIDANGNTNNSAVAAVMGKLLLDILHDEPADPLIFIPVDDRHQTPAKLTALEVTGGSLSMTVEPLDAADRAALLQRIQEPYDTATALIE